MVRSVCFIFPHPVSGPAGGYKVVYEYANRLVADGVEVHVVYSGSIFWKRKPLRFKLSNCVRYLQRCIKGYSCRGWFNLDKCVKEHLSLSMNYWHVPKTDVYVATSPYTAYYLNDYPVDCNRKFYLIQGREDWGPGIRAIFEETYRMPLGKIAVSQWLQRMLRDGYDEDSIYIPNGFDFNKFRMNVSPELRNGCVVSMLYSSQELKRCDDAFTALEFVKKEFPELVVNVYGISERPSGLPDWYRYYRQPDAETHNRINNESAIFIATSESEGWGLTVGEAMICGQAVCCTDNDGYREMAIDGETALLSPVRSPKSLAANIVRLIEDDALRIKIAKAGNLYIQKFQWADSYQKFKSIIGCNENKVCK